MPSTVLAPSQTRRISAGRPDSALRDEVAKWFDRESSARVTRFGRVYPGGSRYVCVSAPKPGGFFALYFFHHGDGAWRTYPPSGIGPSIVYWSIKVRTPVTRAASIPRRRLRAAFKSFKS